MTTLAMLYSAYFDPLWWMLLGPCMALAAWAQFKVKSTYHMASQMPTVAGTSGAEAARIILDQEGLHNVPIEEHEGFLSDHYDPRVKVVRLSPGNYHGRSMAAVGIAAHEVGHAIQDARRYAPLVIRNTIVPLASVGSWLSMVLIMVGVMLMAATRSPELRYVVYAGVVFYAIVVVFQMVNLPVEFDASRRAKLALADTGIVTQAEMAPVRQVLSAAAMTYVAATLTAAVQLIYLLIRLGIIGGQRRQ